ncbi:DUF3261 domain-containing protein [Chitinimonas naiadis]
MRQLIVLLALLLTACATAPKERLTLPELRLAPSAFGRSVSLVQRLTLERVDINAQVNRFNTPRTLQALLEIDSTVVQLAGIAFEQRVLTMVWDGSHLKEDRHPFLPPEVDAAHVLRDVQLVYWPLPAIVAALPAGWTVEDSGPQRLLSYGGKVQVRVYYQGEPRWAGKTEIDNRLEGYRLTIDSTPQAGS